MTRVPLNVPPYPAEINFYFTLLYHNNKVSSGLVDARDQPVVTCDHSFVLNV